jgi:hypothetical protein
VPTEFDYGYLPAFTGDLKDAVLLPVDNAIWHDLSQRIDDLCVRVSLNPAYRHDFFDRVMAMTLDSAAGGRTWYLWCQIPCLKCGWHISYTAGNEYPPKTWHLTILYGTQECWERLSHADRDSAVEALLLEYQEWWGWINPQTGGRATRQRGPA